MAHASVEEIDTLNILHATMLAMCRHLGFQVHPDKDDPAVMDVTLEVGPDPT